MAQLATTTVMTLTDNDLPRLFHQADVVSAQAQRRFFRLLGAELILLSLGTLAGLFSNLPLTLGQLTFGSYTTASLRRYIASCCSGGV